MLHLASWLRRRGLRDGWRSPAPQLLALVGAFALAPASTENVWIWLLPAVAAGSLVAWLKTYLRLRLLADMPSSRVGSAAQGYVELTGRAAAHPGHLLRSRLHALPCLWYRYVVQERRGSAWTTVEFDESEDTFLLKDETGQCTIDPEHADVQTAHKEVAVRGDARIAEYLLLPQDRLYAVGEFSTQSGAAVPLDTRADVADLLTEWKRDKARLVERFDLDGDGEIDEREWALARQAAKREVARAHGDLRAQPSHSVLRAPKDGRPFLIANSGPERFERTYRLWAGWHFAMMIAATASWIYSLAK